MYLTFGPGRTVLGDIMAVFKNLSSLCPCGFLRVCGTTCTKPVCSVEVNEAYSSLCKVFVFSQLVEHFFFFNSSF